MWLLLLLGVGFAGLALAQQAKAKEGEAEPPLLPTTGEGLPDVLVEEPRAEGTGKAEALQTVQAAVQAAMTAAADVAVKAASGDRAAARASCDAAIAAAQEAAGAAQQAGPNSFAMYQQAYNALVKACAAIGEPAPTPTEVPTPTQVEKAPPPTDDIIVRSPGIPQITVEPSVPDEAPPGAEAPPAPAASGLPGVETSADLDPNGTIALARLLLSRETSPAWKGAHTEQVRTWQGKRNLTTDGKFGMNSSFTMAQEVGVLPLIRYWPSSKGKSQALKEYRTMLNDMASAIQKQRPEDQAQATALRLSAAREDGRAYGTANPAPVASQQSVDQLLSQLKDLALGAS